MSINAYEAIAECAVVAVPSEISQDEIKAYIELKQGQRIEVEALVKYLDSILPYFMVPRYVDVVEEIPMTETLRAVKTGMKKQGVTGRTWDREKEMPELKKKK